MKNFSIIFISMIFLSGCSMAANENSGFNENYNPYTNTTANSKNKTDESAKAVPYNGLKKSDIEDVFKRSENPIGQESQSNSTSTLIKPLPENSQLSMQMNEKGYVVETRTFNGLSFLIKIEKTTISPKETKLQIYLKNGKVYDVPEGKMKDFRTATIKTILEAADVRQK